MHTTCISPSCSMNAPVSHSINDHRKTFGDNAKHSQSMKTIPRNGSGSPRVNFSQSQSLEERPRPSKIKMPRRSMRTSHNSLRRSDRDSDNQRYHIVMSKLELQSIQGFHFAFLLFCFSLFVFLFLFFVAVAIVCFCFCLLLPFLFCFFCCFDIEGMRRVCGRDIVSSG